MPSHSRTKRLKGGRVLHGGQYLVHAEIVEEREALTAADGLLNFQGELRLPVGMGELVDPAAAATHPDPAVSMVPLGGQGGPELLPGRLRVRQDDNLTEPGGNQRPDPGLLGSPAYGVEKVVGLIVAVASLNHDNPMRAAEVIAEGQGMTERLCSLHALNKLGDEVAAQARLGLG